MIAQNEMPRLMEIVTVTAEVWRYGRLVKTIKETARYLCWNYTANEPIFVFDEYLESDCYRNVISWEVKS